MSWGKAGARSHGHGAISMPSKFPRRGAQGHSLPRSLEDRLFGLPSMAWDRTEELSQVHTWPDIRGVTLPVSLEAQLYSAI